MTMGTHAQALTGTTTGRRETGRHRRRWPGGAAVLGLSLLIPLAPAASAQPLERGRFEDSTSEVVEGFCGDLTVRIDQTIHGHELLNVRGPAGLAYWMKTVHGTTSFTNLANDRTFTQVFHFVEKDLRVTDNGDGTLSILVLATGSTKVYAPDGRLLFNDPGQIRYEILVDDNGTPADPEDDEELEFLGIVKGSTGRNDLEGRRLCSDIHEFIG